MLVPKKNRLIIYSALFKDGVMTAKKDTVGKHHELEVPNLHVIKLMQSLHSRNYVSYKFNWQWFYYTLTDEGIEYLREYLHLPADTVPNTLKKSNKVQPAPSFGSGRVEGESGTIFRPRRAPFGAEEYRGPKAGAPSDFTPEYAGPREGGARRGRGGFRGRRGGRGGARGGFRGEVAPAAAPAETGAADVPAQ